jgi:hypothetical protein
MLQFATAVVAAFVPLAAGIYLLVTVAWTLGQRLLLRPGPASVCVSSSLAWPSIMRWRNTEYRSPTTGAWMRRGRHPASGDAPSAR